MMEAIVWVRVVLRLSVDTQRSRGAENLVSGLTPYPMPPVSESLHQY